ncbi:condensation domain-containing protein [Anthocerotibacter panamensis]|uniref:condensation domain-containing protein n=1 Tax=Anthocerotibacter panamensis TaxID=2857077 RepID=UPI001C4043CE|nr:condensation domain-containing protein [Anthocerotibacter panamensis]
MTDINLLPPDQQRALLAQLLRQKAAAPSFALSPGQQDLWLWHKIAAQTRRIEFNVLFAWTIRSTWEAALLQQAFQTLVDRHATFRTTYGEANNQPFQRVHRQQKVHFVVTDAQSWPADQLQQAVGDLAHQPFDLEQGPLLRVQLFTRGTTDPVLLLALHHLAIDMWSLSILLDELGIVYTTLKHGIAPSLPPLARQFTDFVGWQTDLLHSPAGQRLEEYWREQMTGAIPVALPTDRPRPQQPAFGGACHGFVLEEALTQGLKDLARRLRTTLYAVLLAAFEVLLYRYSRQEDLSVITMTVGRKGADWSGVIGYFTNAVPLRVNLRGNPPFTTLLEQVHQRLMAALEHQLYPALSELAHLRPKAQTGQPQLTDIFFVFQKSHRFGMERVSSDREAASPIGVPAAGDTGAQVTLGELVLESFPLAWRADHRYILELMMVEAGGSISGVFQYATELFDPQTVERMAQHLTVLLRGVLDQPDTPIAHLPLMTAAEQPKPPRKLPAQLRNRLEKALHDKENP